MPTQIYKSNTKLIFYSLNFLCVILILNYCIAGNLWGTYVASYIVLLIILIATRCVYTYISANWKVTSSIRFNNHLNSWCHKDALLSTVTVPTLWNDNDKILKSQLVEVRVERRNHFNMHIWIWLLCLDYTYLKNLSNCQLLLQYLWKVEA